MNCCPLASEGTKAASITTNPYFRMQGLSPRDLSRLKANAAGKHLDWR